ncbi:MAG: zinc ribbon domain-containing protein [Desulfurococcales archaeon]|nr:zinc ribbon domain-containing protein [Desulfurococcales archaeon]
MSSQAEAGGLDPQRVSSFVSQLDGVNALVVVDEEGFPIEFTGISQEEAEEQAALAVDLSLAVSEHLHRSGGGPREVIVDLGGGEAISVARVRDLLMLLRGLRRPVEAAVEAVGRAASSPLRCPHCKADLTLEAYKCPHCGRSVPFTSRTCPHCGAYIEYKKCPHCGGLLSSSGKPARTARDPAVSRMAILEGVVGGAVLGVIAAVAGASGALIAAAAVAGAAGAGGLVYLAAPKRVVPAEAPKAGPGEG